MQAAEILSTHLSALKGVIHAARLAAVFAAVSAAVRTRRLQLTALGRSFAGSQKHGIKRMDRLLGNVHLRAEAGVIYRAVAYRLLGLESQPVLLIDWTDVGRDCSALVVSLPNKGRARCLYAQVHPRSKLGNPRVERQFLCDLKQVLPAGCTPILVSDGGFRVPWLKSVVKMGWDYVARVRGRAHVQLDSEERPRWLPLKKLFSQAGRQARVLGSGHLTRNHRFATRFVCIAKRSWKAARAKRPPRKTQSVRRHVRSAREPWVLATSLTHASASEVVAHYASRMQIEEAFRDLKSLRFGLGLEMARSSSPQRWTILFLLAALAHFVVCLVGTLAENLALARSFQANTVRSRRTLSSSHLGLLCLNADLDSPQLAQLTLYAAAG